MFKRRVIVKRFKMKIINIRKELDEKTFSNFYSAFNNPKQLQIFKTMIDENGVEKCKERHKLEILTAIIYSISGEVQIGNLNSPIYCMSGFKEQKGRLPNETDRIKIIKGRYYFEQMPNFIISEIGFEIVKR